MSLIPSNGNIQQDKNFQQDCCYENYWDQCNNLDCKFQNCGQAFESSSGVLNHIIDDHIKGSLPSVSGFAKCSLDFISEENLGDLNSLALMSSSEYISGEDYFNLSDVEECYKSLQLSIPMESHLRLADLLDSPNPNEQSISVCDINLKSLMNPLKKVGSMKLKTSPSSSSFSDYESLTREKTLASYPPNEILKSKQCSKYQNSGQSSSGIYNNIGDDHINGSLPSVSGFAKSSLDFISEENLGDLNSLDLMSSEYIPEEDYFNLSDVEECYKSLQLSIPMESHLRLADLLDSPNPNEQSISVCDINLKSLMNPLKKVGSMKLKTSPSSSSFSDYESLTREKTLASYPPNEILKPKQCSKYQNSSQAIESSSRIYNNIIDDHIKRSIPLCSGFAKCSLDFISEENLGDLNSLALMSSEYIPEEDLFNLSHVEECCGSLELNGHTENENHLLRLTDLLDSPNPKEQSISVCDINLESLMNPMKKLGSMKLKTSPSSSSFSDYESLTSSIWEKTIATYPPNEILKPKKCSKVTFSNTANMPKQRQGKPLLMLYRPVEKQKKPKAPPKQKPIKIEPGTEMVYYSYEFIVQIGMKMAKEVGNASKPKPFLCPVENCTKSYKNANGLKYHARYGHSPKQEFPCDLCPKLYTTRHGLMAHKKIHPEFVSTSSKKSASDNNNNHPHPEFIPSSKFKSAADRKRSCNRYYNT